jgi:hypothetical protein
MLNDTRHNWYYSLVWNSIHTTNNPSHSLEILQMQVVYQDYIRPALFLTPLSLSIILFLYAGYVHTA